MKELKYFLLVFLLLSLTTSAYAASGTPIYQSHAVSHNERNLIYAEINGFGTQAEDYLIDIWHCEITDLAMAG